MSDSKVKDSSGGSRGAGSRAPTEEELDARRRIGRALRMLMGAYGLTGVEVARVMHVQPLAVSRYRGGKNVPPSDKLLVLLEHYGVPLSVFEGLLNTLEEPSGGLLGEAAHAEVVASGGDTVTPDAPTGGLAVTTDEEDQQRSE